MTKVFWFSRHQMSEAQLEALVHKHGEVEVTQYNGTAPDVHVGFECSVNGAEPTQVAPIKELIQAYDVVAIVAPIDLQRQFLSVAGDRPVIFAKSERKVNRDLVEFIFMGWDRLVKVEVITEPYA